MSGFASLLALALVALQRLLRHRSDSVAAAEDRRQGWRDEAPMPYAIANRIAMPSALRSPGLASLLCASLQRTTMRALVEQRAPKVRTNKRSHVVLGRSPHHSHLGGARIILTVPAEKQAASAMARLSRLRHFEPKLEDSHPLAAVLYEAA